MYGRKVGTPLGRSECNTSQRPRKALQSLPMASGAMLESPFDMREDKVRETMRKAGEQWMFHSVQWCLDAISCRIVSGEGVDL